MKGLSSLVMRREFANIPLCRIIDVFIICYITSIHIMSYSADLNYISRALALVLMGMLGLYMLSKDSIAVCGFFAYFLIFIAICTFSAMWGKNLNNSISVVMTLLQLFALSILLYNYIIRENKLDFLITVIAISGTIFAFYTVFYIGVTEYFTQMTVQGARLGQEVANVNTIGMTTATSGLILLWKALYDKNKLYYLLMAFDMIVALGSGSRKVFICLLLGFFLILMLQGNKKKRIRYILIAILSLIVFLLVLQLPMFITIRMRINDTIRVVFLGEKIRSAGTDMRSSMTEVGIQQFLKTPFTGVGIGNTYILAKMAVGHSTYLHNNYAELLSSVGLFGTIAFYLMLVIPFLGLVKFAFKGNKYASLVFSLLCIELILQYAMVVYYSKTMYISLVLYWVVYEKIRRDQNEKNYESNQKS